MTKKRSTSKLLIVGLIIVLTILLILGIFFLQKSTTKEQENQMERSSLINTKNNCSNCKKEVFTNDKFCSYCDEVLTHFQKIKVNHYGKKNSASLYSIKIARTSLGKYFVQWRIDAKKEGDNTFLEEGENCILIEKMSEFLTEHQECWENNNWNGWEKELKDNYLLVKSRETGKDNQFNYQTRYEFFPLNEADQKWKEAEQRREECKQRAKECKERARKWKEEHKNEWRTCSKCGKYFHLETEGSINESTTRIDGGEPVEKTKYFCGKCSKE